VDIGIYIDNIEVKMLWTTVPS